MPEECIDIAHRIGRIRKNSGSKNPEQAVIVKFNSWEKCVAVYRARKEVNDIVIQLDLTPRRAKLSLLLLVKKQRLVRKLNLPSLT